jgi:ABC-type transporter Mla subunit MlaD
LAGKIARTTTKRLNRTEQPVDCMVQGLGRTVQRLNRTARWLNRTAQRVDRMVQGLNRTAQWFNRDWWTTLEGVPIRCGSVF